MDLKQSKQNKPQSHAFKITQQIPETPEYSYFHLSLWILLEKLRVTKIVNKFQTSYGTQSFIPVFTNEGNWALSLDK
jgi:hypothetical protein